LEIAEELYACCTEWQKAFDGVKRTTLMQVAKEKDIEWRERRLISKF
jgi:hypothetical protein